MDKKEIMLVAGEASGDLHGAGLVKAFGELRPGYRFFGMGGVRLKKAGQEQVFDLDRMSLMGIAEVVASLGGVLQTFGRLKAELLKRRPAALVLIDYPELNFPLARAAREARIPVFYYVCPQIWAWRTWRIRRMARDVDRRVVVLPFEAEFYRRHGLSADYVGHPILDVLPEPIPKSDAKKDLGLDSDRPLLLLMPGSRSGLVRVLLPVMVEAVRMVRMALPDLKVVLALAETLTEDFVSSLMPKRGEPIEIRSGVTHRLQNAADAALVASGTSTLETALMGTPMAVIYRTHPLSFQLARLLVKTKSVSLPNLIAGHMLVPELLQDQAWPELIAPVLLRLFENETIRSEITSGLARIRTDLGGPGAGRRAARLLLETLRETGPGQAPSQG